MSEIGETINRLVKATEEGCLPEWNDRIGMICRNAGLPTERVRWTLSPEVVAVDVVRLAEQKYNIPELNAAIDDYQNQGQGG